MEQDGSKEVGEGPEDFKVLPTYCITTDQGVSSAVVVVVVVVVVVAAAAAAAVLVVIVVVVVVVVVVKVAAVVVIIIIIEVLQAPFPRVSPTPVPHSPLSLMDDDIPF